MEPTAPLWHASREGEMPMVYDAGGMAVAVMAPRPPGQAHANARFIARAANAHRPLVSACELALAELKVYAEELGLTNGGSSTLAAIEQIELALALTRGEG